MSQPEDDDHTSSMVFGQNSLSLDTYVAIRPWPGLWYCAAQC